ncbi:hypothetical protein CSOJ01_04805 [Colletotrichum sojae]|uniref:Uncharacterized protein n=1 Tax=Colletotrichum sojae TaxID=2175907 RepID=A0A8H6JHA2_9PEZI|nr:hypothetical protein CSOJ01_04805 [Colletotrichum sojae]
MPLPSMLRNRRASVTENMTSTFRSLHIGNPCGSGAGLEGCERGIVYTRFSDIPAREVVSCADFWERLVDALGPDFEFEGIHTNGLWGLVFAGGWTTADPPAGRGGKLQGGPPEAGCEYRTSDGLPPADADAAKPMPDFPERRKGAPAFIIFTAVANDHLYGGTFTFCDANANPTPQSYIEYKLVDEHERERLRPFNEDLAVYVIRKRLCRWAREGYRAAGSVPSADEGDMAEFKSLQVSSCVLGLMGDAMETYQGDTWEEEYDIYF